MTSFDLQDLRGAFGAFMTGVTVVTTHDSDGNPLGFTANSFTSVSLDPPVVLVCLANTSRSYTAFAEASGFAVNVLSEAQKEVSNTFARPVVDRFSVVDWRPGPYGSPVFAGVSAWFDCSMFNTVEAGDHLILMGKVEAYENSTHPGLGYVRGAYVTPTAEVEALTNHANLMVSALITRQGRALLVETEGGILTLPEARVGKDGASTALRRLIASSGASAEAGFIYSVYEDQTRETQHIAFVCHASGFAADQGGFCALDEQTLAAIADPAARTMLRRFATESQMGNFGVYFGNQDSGTIRSVTSEG